VGLTEDSQAVADANYQKFVVEQQERLKQLQTQGEVTEESTAETAASETNSELKQAA
jgi:hypothetical protein